VPWIQALIWARAKSWRKERRGGEHQDRLDVVDVEKEGRAFGDAGPGLEEQDEQDQEDPGPELRDPEKDGMGK
jgi:hypothetical protein